MKLSKKTVSIMGGTERRKRAMSSESILKLQTLSSEDIKKKLGGLICASCLPMAFLVLIKVLDDRDG